MATDDYTPGEDDWNLGAAELQKCREFVLALRENGGRLTTDGLFGFVQRLFGATVEGAVKQVLDKGYVRFSAIKDEGGEPVIAFSSAHWLLYDDEDDRRFPLSEVFDGEEDSLELENAVRDAILAYVNR